MDRREGRPLGNIRTSPPSTPQNASGSMSISNAPLTPSTGSLRARRFPSPRAAARSDMNPQYPQQQRHAQHHQRHQSGSGASAGGGSSGAATGECNSPARSLGHTGSMHEIHTASPALPPLQQRQQDDPIVSLLGHQSSESFGEVTSNASPTSQSPTSVLPHHVSKDSMTVHDFYSMHASSFPQHPPQCAQRGVTVIYPQTCSPVDPYSRGPDYGSARAVSVTEEDANEDRVQVRVEGFFENNDIGVLIPNDLPPSTLLYVLTASDGRDLMFKLIQYSLQLTICFLKTPALFSPEVQALMGPLAERLYRNYNTIRHGRSLFKMGRGLLNLFTVQTVCERMYAKYESAAAYAAGAVMLPIVTRLERAVMMVLGVSPLWGHYCSARLLRWVQAAQLTPGQSRRDDVEDSAALDWRIQQRIRDQQQMQQQSAAAAASGAVQGTLLSDDMYTHVSVVERAAQSSSVNVAQLAGSSATGLKPGSSGGGGFGFTLRKVAGYAGAIDANADGYPQPSQPAFPYAAGDYSRTNTSAEHSDQHTPTSGVAAAAVPPMMGLDGGNGVASVSLPMLPRIDSAPNAEEPPRHFADTPDVANTAAPTPYAVGRSRGNGRPPATPPPPAMLEKSQAIVGAPHHDGGAKQGLRDSRTLLPSANMTTTTATTASSPPSSSSDSSSSRGEGGGAGAEPHAKAPPHVTGTLPLSVELGHQQQQRHGLALTTSSSSAGLASPFGLPAKMPTTTGNGINTTAAGAAAAAATAAREAGSLAAEAAAASTLPAGAHLTADWVDGSSRTTLLHPIKRPSRRATPLSTANSSMTVDDLHVGADNSVTRDGIPSSLMLMPGAAQSSSYGSMLGSTGIPEMASGGGLMPGEGPLSVPNNWHVACAPTVPPSQSDEPAAGPPTLPFPSTEFVVSIKAVMGSSTATPPSTATTKVHGTAGATDASTVDTSSDPSVSSPRPTPSSSLPPAANVGGGGGARGATATPALPWPVDTAAQRNGTVHNNTTTDAESSAGNTLAAEGPPDRSTDTAVHASVKPATHGGAVAAAALSNSSSHNRCPAFEYTESYTPRGNAVGAQGSADAAPSAAPAAAAPPAAATSTLAPAAPPNSIASGTYVASHRPQQAPSKELNESDMSIRSSSTSSSFHVRQGGAGGALSTWLKELQPAEAALPARWRKGPLQFNTLLMTLLGIRNLAAACRRFLRDATLVSTERFGTFQILEAHRHLITRIINRCWLLVSIIDLVLNTVRLLQPGWVKYATARQNIHCRCGCQGDDDPADMVWRTHGFIARRKTDLFFPPLDLDYGAPFVSCLAYVEAADPAKLMPACSRCGFLYREVASESDSEVDDVDAAAAARPAGATQGTTSRVGFATPPPARLVAAAGGAIAGLPKALAAGTPPPHHRHLAGTTSFSEDPHRSAHHSHLQARSTGQAASLGTAGSVEREKPRWVQIYDEEVLLGESQQMQQLQLQQRLRPPGGGRRETQRPTAMASGEAGLNSPVQDLEQHPSNSTVVDAIGDAAPATAEEARLQRRKGGAGHQQPAESSTGILFVPWIMRKFFDYVWLLRVHPNLTSTVLLEARCIAELYLAYKYCFSNFETYKADAPLSAILNPYCALAGMVSAAVGLLRVVESAPSS